MENVWTARALPSVDIAVDVDSCGLLPALDMLFENSTLVHVDFGFGLHCLFRAEPAQAGAVPVVDSSSGTDGPCISFPGVST